MSDGWLPIETAPKDCSSVLLLGSKGMAVGYWDEFEEGWISDYRGKGGGSYVDATQWQPLPAPPSV